MNETAIGILSIVGITLAIFEFATLCTVGPPWIRRSRARLFEQIQSGQLNQYNNSILSTPNGYISTCGFGITGSLYYSECFGGTPTYQTRIPWWTPEYTEYRRKMKELRTRQESIVPL